MQTPIAGRLLAPRFRIWLLALFALLCCANPALAQGDEGRQRPTDATLSSTDTTGLHELLTALNSEYLGADPTHETTQATIARLLARGARARVSELAPQSGALGALESAHTRRALQSFDRLVGLLGATTVRFQPWPLPSEVEALSASAQRQLEAIEPAGRTPASPYGEIDSALNEVDTDTAGGRRNQAGFALLRAYALYAAGPGRHLPAADPALADQIANNELLGTPPRASLAYLLEHGGSVAQVERASARARSQMGLVAQTLGEVHVSRATIVTDAAIIVFREGLEAVLILAAITASCVGVRSHLRRPILIGAVAGLVATVLTWVIAQMILHLLGNGGLELQAVTGLIAIGVLLLVTNWFFHRVYWSEWISRFNRRRKALERLDKTGFISGQVLGFVLLGLSSVYREGLETVLFLQALQTSAGTQATALGAGIGLSGTLIVGVATLKMQRKLPYKRMLIATGMMIALVLAVMVGTTVHNMQGIGWLPITPTSFNVPIAWNTWFGVYSTVEGIGAQVFSLVFVIGSYFVARELQVNRHRRRTRHDAHQIAPLGNEPGLGT
jgi:high-affinity iron transporter